MAGYGHDSDTDHTDTSQKTQAETPADSGSASAGMAYHEKTSQDKASQEEMPEDEMSEDEATTSQTTAAGTNASEKECPKAQAKAKPSQGQADTAGRTSIDKANVIGKLVDRFGRLQGYVIRPEGEANRYVIVLPENIRERADAAADEPAAAHTQTDGGGVEAANTVQRQRLLEKMYQKLQEQARRIRMLSEQLAQRQAGAQAWMDGGQAATALRQPLDQVAHIIVDDLGHIQAIVLESGVVLASDEWDGSAALR